MGPTVHCNSSTLTQNIVNNHNLCNTNRGNNPCKQADASNLDLNPSILRSNYRVGAWNINGWYSSGNQINTQFKIDVIEKVGFDVIMLTETFCRDDDLFTIPNFTVVQYNRKSVSRRCIRGSGGCAIAINNDLLSNHVIVATYKGKQDGILSVKLRCVDNDVLIGLLVNYLPPDNYHFGKDPESFFNDNSLIYSDLSDCDLVVCGGDLNSRTKEDLDFIVDVDGNCTPRSNPDLEKNSHGNYFLDFLKDNRALICNGRVTPELNDFTFISPRGRSVPDYIYCPADHIQYCTSCSVLKVSSVIDQFCLPVPNSLPDHSILLSEFDISYDAPSVPKVPSNSSVPNQSKLKKNVRKIDDTFLASPETLQLLNSTIVHLETITQTQNDVDQIYSEIKKLFMSEIEKLPVSSRKDQKTLRKASPFWNSELQALWKERTLREDIYTAYKCDGKVPLQRYEKSRLLSEFKSAQKMFDRKFQFYKRQHSSKSFRDLADLADKASSDPAEMWKRLKALSDHKPAHVLLEVVRDDETICKDIKVVLEKWHKDFSECFKGIKDDPDLVFDDEFLARITKLKDDFDVLSENEQESKSRFDSVKLNCEITYQEVSNAIDQSKLGKAYLSIPNEALKNNAAKFLLHKFFNKCFELGLSPTDWLQSELKPLFKGGDKDPRAPLDHRPICIMSCVAKIYSCVLNNRLQSHLNCNDLLSDTQNGFRSGRSCIDHVFSLVTILRNRKLTNQQTFLCFVDFRRAFDSVNHDMLFHTLSSKFGIVGKMYKSLLSLYTNPITRVVLTAPGEIYRTEFFNCPLGVKQGDILSPTLFSMFVNDLTVELKNSGLGVSLDAVSDETSSSDGKFDSKFIVNHLIYADDLVCIAPNANDLQALIDIVSLWCSKFRLEANLLKTEVLHVRKSLVPRSKFRFKFGKRDIQYCQQYKYLGLYIDQFLNFEKMSNLLFEPAKRALNAVMCKMFKNKGFPHSIYKMLYDSCVTTIKDYGHEVIGFHEYSGSTNIHTKALRIYLGVGHSANLCGLRSEMTWPEPRSRTQVRMIRFLFRMKSMSDDRLTKKIFRYDQNFAKTHKNLTCWSSEINQILTRNNLFYNVDNIGSKPFLNLLSDSLLKKDVEMFASQCRKSPKLRTYHTLFPPFEEHNLSTKYVKLNLPFIVRKRLAQVRLGVLPIRIESDRYARVKIAAELRFCKQPHCINQTVPNCEAIVEDEVHFMLQCKHYEKLRSDMFSKVVLPGFSQLTDRLKFKHLLTCEDLARTVGQYIINAFDKRPVK